MKKNINIINKRAKHDYIIIEKFNAGIVLTGTEIKSIRSGKAVISDSFCEFNSNQELFIINMFIDKYSHGNINNHESKSERKLLLTKLELKKLNKAVKNKGLTIVPLRLFINEKGLAKLVISLSKGKKLFDKRQAIKNRDNKIELERIKKISNIKN